MMKKSDSIAELATALSQFQAKVKQPEKNKINPFFKSNYAPLESIVKAIAEVLGEFGLSFTQFPLNDEQGRIGIITLLMHKSGEWIESTPIFAMPAKQDAQGVGSVITYLKRYSLSATFGITPDDDDDGNNAQHTQQSSHTPSQPQQQGEKLITSNQIKALHAAISDAAKRTNTTESQVTDYAKGTLEIPLNVETKVLTSKQASRLITFINQIPPMQQS